MHKPGEILWKVALKILTYIKRSSSKNLLYKKHEHLQSDFNYVGDKRDRKSTYDYCHLCWSNLVSWRTKKQSVVSHSSTEVEYNIVK